MHNRCFFNTEFNLTAFGNFHCFRYVWCHSTELRIWHRPRGQVLSPAYQQPPSYQASRYNDQSWFAFEDFIGKSSAPTRSAPALKCISSFIATGKYSHANRFTDAVWHRHHTAHLLIRLFRVNTKVNRYINRLVNLVAGAAFINFTASFRG